MPTLLRSLELIYLLYLMHVSRILGYSWILLACSKCCLLTFRIFSTHASSQARAARERKPWSQSLNAPEMDPDVHKYCCSMAIARPVALSQSISLSLLIILAQDFLIGERGILIDGLIWYLIEFRSAFLLAIPVISLLSHDAPANPSVPLGLDRRSRCDTWTGGG